MTNSGDHKPWCQQQQQHQQQLPTGHVVINAKAPPFWHAEQHRFKHVLPLLLPLQTAIAATFMQVLCVTCFSFSLPCCCQQPTTAVHGLVCCVHLCLLQTVPAR